MSEKVCNIENQKNNATNLEWNDFLIFVFLEIGILFFLCLVVGIYSAASRTNIFATFMGEYSLLLDAIIFLILLIFLKTIRQFVLQSIDFSVMRKPISYIFLLLSLISLYISKIFLIDILNSGRTVPTVIDNSNTIHLTSLTIFIVLFSIVIVTPIKEELFFRGIFQSFLTRKYGFNIGLIVPTIVFGLLHFDYPLLAIVMGCIFALLYKLTHSIIPPILSHFIWNLIVVLFNIH